MLANVARDRLRLMPAVALFGPRQIGKTTLARKIADETHGIVTYLDVEQADAARELLDERNFFESHREGLVVIDEVQMLPEIFRLLRGKLMSDVDWGSRAGNS